MDHVAWGEAERILDASGVKPLVAVVPENVDPELRRAPADPEFWSRVRAWQAKGWGIGLHGHRHHYLTRSRGLIGAAPRSEFAGEPPEAQLEKLRRGIEVFSSHGVRIDAFVAPSHTFDTATLDALVRCGIRVISDGYYGRVCTDARGLTWIPQQLWTFSERDRGLWTICYHPNGWSATQLSWFQDEVRRFAARATSIGALLAAQTPRMSLADRLEARTRLGWMRARAFAVKVRDGVGGGHA